MPEIRQIGDALLHHTLPPFDWNKQHDLSSMLSIMRRNLNETGGVGIAANQCAEIVLPSAVVIVGTSDPHIKKKIKQRYPNHHVPDELIMINPEIIDHSDETYYPNLGEGCLSVKGALRGRVQRYTSVTVRYQNENGESLETTFDSFTAHVIQHEVDHLRGIVYIEKIIKELSTQQLQLFASCLEKSIASQKTDVETMFISQPNLIFDRNDKEIIFSEKALMEILDTMETITLEGIQSRLV